MGEIYLFPGGNTPHGFVNRFDDIIPFERARRVYFIKGGSGVGKSTFMRAIGEHCARAGLDIEYFSCSSDPSSLDGVAVPGLGAALMDATAPHMMDPRLPGVRDFTLDLGRFLDERRFEGMRAALEASMARRKACFEHAYACLSAALPLYIHAGCVSGELLKPEDELGEELEHELADWAEQCVSPGASGSQHYAGGNLEPDAKRPGRLRRLFADAITPAGFVSTLNTLPARRRVYVELPWGCDASGALERMAARALRQGEDALLLLNPLAPERALHLYLPARSLLICADGGLLERAVRFDRRVSGTALELPASVNDARLRAAEGFDRRECMRLIDEAVALLGHARKLHAEVESAYSSAMDFEEVRRLRDEVCKSVDLLLP